MFSPLKYTRDWLSEVGSALRAGWQEGKKHYLAAVAEFARKNAQAAQDLEAASQSNLGRQLKAIDVPVDGDELIQVAIKASGQNNGLVSFEPPIVPSVVRIIFDDISREDPLEYTTRSHLWGIFETLNISRPPTGDYGSEPDLYPACTNRFRSTYKPQVEYQNGTNIQGINFSKLYSRLALHRLFEPEIQREWFAVEVFAGHTCRGSHLERRVVAFTILGESGCSPEVICYTHRKKNDPTDWWDLNDKWSPILRKSRPLKDDDSCADVGQRWQAHIEHAIKQYPRGKQGDFPTVMLERTILNILVATIEQNLRFLDTIVSHLDREDGPFEYPSEPQPQLTSQILRRLGRSFDELYPAALWVVSRIRSRLELDHVAPSAITDFVGLEHLEEDLASSRRELTFLIQGFIEDGRTRLDRYSSNQSDNVGRLTILATCSLPLSISATVLSMQTRFPDLGLLLYDLVGVAFLFGFIALTVFLLSKKIMTLHMKRKPGDQWISFGRTQLKTSRMLLVYPGIILLTVSFLIGMFMDEIAGLKVLGFEAAGSFGLLVLLTFLAVIADR